MPHPPRPFCQITGFGPGCTSLLIAADRAGLLRALLQAGLIIHEASPDETHLLQTGLNYDIISNSSASDFLDGIAAAGWFGTVLDRPAARMLAAQGDAPASLQLVAALIADIRARALELISLFPQSAVRFGSRVARIRRQDGGLCAETPADEMLTSSVAVLACGSHPVVPDTLSRAAEAAQVPLLHAEQFLRPGGPSALPATLRRVAIIGGSHSAFSVLHKLLEHTQGADGQPLQVDLYHIAPLRRMHLSQEAARAAQEHFDPTQDVCPASGRVFRFQGLYTRSRQLLEQVQAGQHPHVQLHHADAAPYLARADVVLCATGYAPNLPELVEVGGSAHAGIPGRKGAALAVGPDGQLQTAEGTTLTGLYGIGHGFGRNQSGIGEPSYAGTPVGVNIFQGPDGSAICDSLSRALSHTSSPQGTTTTHNRRKAG